MLCCLGKSQSRPKPRGGSTLSSFDRSNSQIARSASTSGARLKAPAASVPDPFSYTPCIVMSSSPGVSNPRSPGNGGARRNWRRAMRPMPPSQSSERRSFAPTSSTSDLQHRDLSGGSDRSAKIADERDSLIPPQSSLIAGLNSLLRRKNSLLGCVGNWPRKRLDQLTFSGT